MHAFSLVCVCGSIWSLVKNSIRSEFSWRRVFQRASDTGWEQVRSHCTQKRRTLGTKCAPSGSVGKRACWLKCGSRGRGEWWCRRQWTRRWSSAHEPPEWRRFQISLKPRKWCESDSKIVAYLWLNGGIKAVQSQEYPQNGPIALKNGLIKVSSSHYLTLWWDLRYSLVKGKQKYSHSVTKKFSIVMTTVCPLNM